MNRLFEFPLARVQRLCAATLVCLMALLVAACGGGADPIAPIITTQPAAVTLVEGQTATFSVTANGSDPLSYQWRKDGADIDGATGASYTTAALTSADNGAQYTVVVSNEAGTATSEVATLTVGAAIAPSIATQPADVSVVSGSTATFSVVANGSDPLSYQWRKDGVAIPDATASSYTTQATTDGDDGSIFSIVISNAGGEAISEDATLDVTAVVVAPTITIQPANATVNVEQPATFSVTAAGTAPLAYEWRRNGVAIAGATLSTYATPATVAADDGAVFSVVVSNAHPTPATSQDAILRVTADLIAPAIIVQPASVSVNAGSAASFNVSVTGSVPLAYQWQRNGVDIAGATGATYTLASAVVSDNGAEFTVQVSNAAGTAVSEAAVLTVNANGVNPGLYPTDQITLVVPYAAGGFTDLLARRLATALSKQLGQAVVVSNVGGAGGNVGAEQVAEATADGYTLLLGGTSLATASTLYRNLSFDPIGDFEYLGLIDEMPLTVVGKPTLPAEDFSGLTSWMKANEGTFFIANAGLGSASDLCSLAFQAATGITGGNLPYKGSGPAMTDLIAGHVDLLCAHVSEAGTFVESEDVKAYGVTSSKRVVLASLSSVPTLSESGLADFHVTWWHGLYAPRGTPPPVLDTLNAALGRALSDADFIASEEALGSFIVDDSRLTSAGHRGFVEAEVDRWRPLIEARGQYGD